MGLRLYETPAGFLAENEAFLQQYEPVVQLSLGNARAHRDEPCGPGLLFGRYEEQGEAVLLFGWLFPWNLCLNAAPGDPRAPLAAAELARYLLEKGIPIPGINARKDLCGAFRPAYGGTFRLHTAMDIMVLRELVPPPAVPGRVRKACGADLERLTEWGMAFHREVIHDGAGAAEIRQKYAEHVEQKAVALFETPEGVPVSMAYASRGLPHGAGISGVYTPPEFRGRGYCQCTVAALCRELLEQGNAYCTLFVDKANPISNRVYEKIGFAILEDCCDYRLEEGTAL